MIRVQREDFDVGAEIEALTRGKTGIGGVASFVGIGARPRRRRAHRRHDARALSRHDRARARRDRGRGAAALAAGGVLIVHRYGRLEPGERIVLVATASAHRQAAFDAASS